MPVRRLVGKTHELKKHNWGPISMGRVLETLEEAMQTISEHPEKILDEKFMMNIF